MDALFHNPYESKQQRREREVRVLLEKVTIFINKKEKLNPLVLTENFDFHIFNLKMINFIIRKNIA